MTPLAQTKDRLPTCGGDKQGGTVWGGRWRVVAQSGENSWHTFKCFIHKALSLALGVVPTSPAPCHLTGLQATPSTRPPHPGQLMLNTAPPSGQAPLSPVPGSACGRPIARPVPTLTHAPEQRNCQHWRLQCNVHSL